MSRRIFAFVFVLAIACGNGLAPASGLAPADEYFGPFKQSILEIRNRLVAFERDSDRGLRGQIRGLDNLELAIEDWHRHYPRDTWIPGFAHRLARVYARAHAVRDRGYRVVARLR